jgi:hypothetical protein
LDPDERNPFKFITELSGDLAENDPDGVLDDNAYHVVTAAAMGSVATLSGLVIFGGNAGEEGSGGGILAPGGRLVLSACTLKDNLAWRGGAIYIEAGELHLFQCRFLGNSTTGEGGAIFDAMANLEAHNCLFALNGAGSDGGAIFLDLCEADFLNCSFGGNHSASRGGGIYEYVGVTAYAGNSIFWGNTDVSGSGQSAQIFINPSNTILIEHSCVQGWPENSSDNGNFGDDPLLADWPNGDLHLLPGSPCIDQGNNALVGSQLDLDGNPRIVNGNVDIGCFEFQGSTGLPEVGFGNETPRIVGFFTPLGAAGGRVFFLPPREGQWSVVIYDVSGRRLRLLSRGQGASGLQEIFWDGRDTNGRQVPSGVYLFTLWREDLLLDSSKGVYLR